MKHGENFDDKLQEFSVVKKCPRCGRLSLSFKNELLVCGNCGYTENIPTVR